MRHQFTACLVVMALVASFAFLGTVDAQRGPGGGGGKGPKAPPGLPKKLPGKGSKTIPALQINDVKPDGEIGLASLLPASGEQMRLGITETMAYRLVSYSQTSHSFRFATLDFASQKQSQFDVPLPKSVKPFNLAPRVCFGGSETCIVSQQAQVCFVSLKDKKVVVVGDIDSKAPLKEAAPTVKGRKGKGAGVGKAVEAGPPTGGEYRVHGLAGGSYALSVLRNYDGKNKKWISTDATLYSSAGKAVTLKFDHNEHGVPPRNKDSVFGIKGDEAYLLTVRPQKAGNFKAETEIRVLVFDLKTGALKEAQTCPDVWGGEDADTFMMTPTGDFFVAQPWGKYDRFVTARGTWKQGYKTDYYDACVGFTPDGATGLFLGNNTPQRAFLSAIALADGKEVWKTTVTHEQAQGNAEDEPFTSVCAQAKAVATHFGIIAGKTADEAEFIFKGEAVSFEPLAMTYDQAGKQIAVLATDRVFILDAKSHAETRTISFEKALNKGAQAECINFNKAGDKLLACVKNAGVWLFDLTAGNIIATLPAVGGDHVRALPDLSGVLFTQSAAEGGNLMLQAFGQDKPTRFYRAEYEEVQAICLWNDEKGESFLVTERGMGEGNLFLVNKKGEKTDVYSVKEIEARLVGDNAVTAFVAKNKTCVLINDIDMGGTLLNCTVIAPTKDDPDPVTASFQVTIKTEELGGRSTYGATGASPYFAGMWVGDDKSAYLACPAGVLTVDTGKASFTLTCWNRKPAGVVAVNPRSKEFFVAGSTGMSVYKLK